MNTQIQEARQRRIERMKEKRYCSKCGKEVQVGQGFYKRSLLSWVYFCDECKANLTEQELKEIKTPIN